MSTYRQRLSGTEQRPRMIVEAVRVTQQVIDKIWHGATTANNTEWSPETSGGLNLGSASRNWGNAYFSGSIVGPAYWAHALCGGI